MKNFGKLVQTPEQIELGDGRTAVILVLRNGDGTEWHDLFKQYPHTWYIAVQEDGVIISMESDPEQSQLADIAIWGIDSDFGFTRGPGGSVYGKVWNGEKIVVKPVLPENISLSPDQFYSMLDKIGKIDEFVSAIETITPTAKKLTCRNQFNNATSFTWEMVLLQLVAPKVSGENWQQKLAPIWIAAGNP